MQDNIDKQFEMDDQFADHAWTDMKRLLDQEMPVRVAVKMRRKRKFYAALLLLFLTSFGAGIGSVLLWQQKMEKAQPEQTPQAPFAAISESSEGASSVPAKANDTKLTTSADHSLASAANHGQYKKGGIQIFKSIDQSANYFQNTIANFINKSLWKNSLPGIFTLTSDPIAPYQSEESLNLKTKETESFEKSGMIPLALSKAVFKWNAKDEKEEAVTKVVIPCAKKIKFNWGFLTGLHSEATKGYGGFSAGLIVDAEVDHRFGIETGLMFSRLQFNDIILNNSPDEFDLNHLDGSAPGLSEEVTGTPYTRASNGSSTPVALGSASYLSVPVLLTYKPSRKLRVNMGVEYARMFSASSNKLRNNGSKLDFATSYTWLDSSSSYGDLLKKTNFSAVFGFSFLPNDLFGFDVRYNHGFTDLSENTGQFAPQNDTRESLQFSLIYNLGLR